MKKPVFKQSGNQVLDYNFTELTKRFSELFDGCAAKQTEVVLSTGDNEIVPTIANPQGRFITFQSAAADLFDKGLNINGKWVLNASAPCTIRIAFF